MECVRSRAALACSPRQPILILLPIAVDNPLLFLGRKLAGTTHSLAVAGILGRPKHVPIIGLGPLNLITQALNATRRKLECGETHTVSLPLPTLVCSIFTEHGHYICETICREIPPDNTLHIRARNVGCRLPCHGAQPLGLCEKKKTIPLIMHAAEPMSASNE